MVLGVGEYTYHLFGGFTFLNDHHLEVLLHVMIGVVELLQELREGIGRRVAEDQDVLTWWSLVGLTVLGTELHQLVQLRGLLGDQHDHHDDEHTNHDPRKVRVRCDISIPDRAYGYDHIIERRIERQLGLPRLYQHIKSYIFYFLYIVPDIHLIELIDHSCSDEDHGQDGA